jgi:hypothetical protein
MSELVRDAQQEFWRPPMAQPSATADSCGRCGTEFMVGAAFCHICGKGRHRPSAPDQAGGWMKYISNLHNLEFANVKRLFGLPAPSLCAFLLGAAFLVLAVSMGFLNSEFEAVQLWRIQWLIAACAAFLAGILLNNRPRES